MAEQLISTSEAARIMGVSRVTIFNKIKKGEIKARKIGRNYVIDRCSLGSIFQELTPASKRRIDAAVRKVASEYGPALRKLGRE